MAKLLEIDNLRTQFLTSAGTVRAVDGVIRKVTPEVVAIAEGAAEIETYDPSDFVPYERVETVLDTYGRAWTSARC